VRRVAATGRPPQGVLVLQRVLLQRVLQRVLLLRVLLQRVLLRAAAQELHGATTVPPALRPRQLAAVPLPERTPAQAVGDRSRNRHSLK